MGILKLCPYNYLQIKGALGQSELNFFSYHNIIDFILYKNDSSVWKKEQNLDSSFDTPASLYVIPENVLLAESEFNLPLFIKSLPCEIFTLLGTFVDIESPGDAHTC